MGPARPTAPSPPAELGALARARPVDLERWLIAGEVQAEAGIVALQELDRREPARAVEAARQVALKGSDRQVVANAVALLARSSDPRAAEALAALPPKYRQLAASLRQASR